MTCACNNVKDNSSSNVSSNETQSDVSSTSSQLPEKEFDVMALMSAGNVTERNVTKYTDEELEEMGKVEGLTLFQLNAIYPVESLRNYFSEYRATYFGDRYVLEVYFDKNQEFSSSWSYRCRIDSKKLDLVEIGDTLYDVKEIDPNFHSTFGLGTDVFPDISVHYTTDGYIFTFTYDSEKEIIKIIKELI